MTGSPVPVFPAVSLRGVHLDLKGFPPELDRLIELLDVIAAARYNVLLVEWEDMFPWTVDIRFRGETAYSPEQVKRFHEEAFARGLEIIPLVQCLGHMETPLSVPGYESLREVSDRADVLNVLAPGAGDLIARMVDDVLTLCPDVRRFHLGGDEAWTFGTHPDTRTFAEQHGKDRLYLQHVEPVLDRLIAQNIRPILWHDMMVSWTSPQLRRLAEKTDLMVWGYQGHPDRISPESHGHRRHIDRLAEHGFRLWCAGGFKGCDGLTSDLPVFSARRENALAWMDLHQTLGFIGAIATGWSRYYTTSPQCDPIDASLDTLIDLGCIFHDGVPMPGGASGCAAWLHAHGEGERFERCVAALRNLSDARTKGWAHIHSLRHILATGEQGPRRRAGLRTDHPFQFLHLHIQEAHQAADRIRIAFQGRVSPLWVERYLDERIRPMVEELAEITRRLNEWDASAF